MAIKALDTEYTLKCPIGKNKGHAMWYPNYVVLAGVKNEEDIDVEVQHTPSASKLLNKVYDAEMLVGHNIKVDLLYTYRKHVGEVMPPIWDTQLAEYLLTGQQHRYPALDDLIEKYLSSERKKDALLKEMWDSGKDTDEIPTAILKPYLVNDTSCTLDIFRHQWRIVNENGWAPFFISQMEALRATIAMNLVGMAVDTPYVLGQITILTEAIDLTLKEWELLTAKSVLRLVLIGSPKDLSLMFFGGEVKTTVRKCVGKYKNGKDKYKNEVETSEVKGFFNPNDFGFTKNALGYYSTDDAVLDKLAAAVSAFATPLSVDTASIINCIRRFRKAVKIKETYYENLRSLTFPNGKVYPNLVHTATATGRLACNAPNLQNQTSEGDVKKAYTSASRDGILVEFDYSQLEVVWLAYLSKDAQLVSDITNGVDIHSELYKDMYGRYPTKGERKDFKPRTFQLIYGAGAKAIAEQGGIPIPEAKKFINVFYTRYPGILKWHQTLVEDAKKGKCLYYKEDDPSPHYSFEYTTPWGRKFHFEAYENDWSKECSFSPTELKNYPVQSSATGDMVPLMLGIVQRKLEELGWYQSGFARLIMTVHDSILLDVSDQTKVECVLSMIKQVLQDAPLYLKKYLNINFPCPLNVGVYIGKNWQDMTEIKGELI